MTEDRAPESGDREPIAAMSRPALALLLIAAGLIACNRSPAEVVSVGATAGGHEEALRKLGMDTNVLTAAASEGLAVAGLRKESGQHPYRARLSVVSLRRRIGEDGVPLAEIAVDLELLPATSAGTPVLETGVGTARLSSGSSAGAWRSALDSAARNAAAGLALALAEQGKPLGKLLADLGSRDEKVREQAIRVIGDRRSVEAVPALIERLEDPEPLVAERAAGALAQLRDPRGVGPLIDYSRRGGDEARTARFARLIGDIGGKEARGYLLTLESGHADARVRAAASDALRELEEREQERARSAADEGGRESGAGDSDRMQP